MSDTLEIILRNFVTDSVKSESIDTISSNFINQGKAIISPGELPVNHESDYIIYAVLILSGVVAFIWHFMPDRFRAVFTLRTGRTLRNNNQNPIVVGALITITLTLNFFVITGIFIYLIIDSLDPNLYLGLSFFQSIGYSYLILLGLIVFRTVFIYSLSFIFNTSKMRREQILMSRNILFITGVILLPFVFILLYSGSIIPVYFAIVIALLLQLIRIVKTFAIGNSDTMFSALHIILYLCALEIAPVLVLVRLIGNSSVL